MAKFEYKGKNVFYTETGSGAPLLLLHGNTASSVMFGGIIDLYAQNHTVILMDFLGHGRSDRLEVFPTDFWFDEAMQAIALLEQKEYGPVDVIGTSGGAIVALNIALERPDLVRKIIADSFEGEASLDVVADFIVKDREASKKNADSVQFWQYMHGDDWEPVVDNDTDVMVRHHEEMGAFFHRDLAACETPVLLTVSLEDEFFALAEIEAVYKNLSQKMPNASIHIFPTGQHPAFLSSGEDFAKIAEDFLRK